MNVHTLSRIAPAFARLFEEPDVRWPDVLDDLRALAAVHQPEAAPALDQFAAETAGASLDASRELHARTFDLAPACVPYLSVHAFGEESFKRARLMAGLAAAYRAAGFDPRGELPDHLAVVLHFLPVMTPAEQVDLVQYVLRPGIDRMADALASSANPYRHLIAALRAALAQPLEPEAAHG
jgi:nitrate reductase delta subunit